MSVFEVNCDGLVGPTHNYSGLAFGNVASASNAGGASNPKAAALQGLAKMKFLASLGLKQIVLPPQERPAMAALRAIGFSGTDAQLIEHAAKDAPNLLAHAYSASAMWTANAATIAPSADTPDNRVHFTPANLISSFHRSLEAEQTARTLRMIFKDARYFTHHAPLPATPAFSDEGAANHTRLCEAHGAPGLHLFVYGRDEANRDAAPQHFPARQTLQASQAVARLHGLSDAQCVFARQHPAAIDAGVFHNDVIAVGNGNVLFCHEQAFAERETVFSELRAKWKSAAELHIVEVKTAEVSLEETVKSYLFNSQLINLPSGGMALLCPVESEENKAVRTAIDRVTAANDNPIQQVHFLNLRESMKNGGGPACLRLRVVVREAQWHAVHAGVKFSDGLYAQLTQWVEAHYRDRLLPADLADPALLDESRYALEALTNILDLTGIYPFQGGKSSII